MRLSKAIVLGDSLKGRMTHAWLYVKSGKLCGCALGGAYLASIGDMSRYDSDRRSFEDMLRDVYPWVSDNLTSIIGGMYAEGKPIEQIADYVRLIEPDCDCNRFNCDCAKPAVEVPEMEYVTRT